MIGIPIGLAVANAFEWWTHKNVLHSKSADPDRYYGFHLNKHHGAALKNGGHDDDYTRPFWACSARRREVVGLVCTVIPFLPLAPVAPFFTATVTYSALRYYRAHKRAHLDPAWAKTHLPWHYDHHMGPDQHANWCVTRPWFDQIMGTRKPYVGTPDEARDETRRSAAKAVRRPA